MKRFLIAISLGISITFSLFLFMSVLVSGGKQFKKTLDSGAAIEFIRMKRDSSLETRRRKLPQKPPEPQKAPKTPKIKVANKPEVTKPQMKMNIPKLDIPATKGDGPFLGQAGMDSGNSELMPLVRIEPQYPRKAAMTGVQGWVKLKFDITQLGTVENVDVLESQPRRMFDSSAKRALLKYKYKPQMVDGRAVAVRNQKIVIDYKLEQ